MLQSQFADERYPGLDRFLASTAFTDIEAAYSPDTAHHVQKVAAQLYKLSGSNPAQEAEIPSRVARAEEIISPLTTDEVVSSIEKWGQLIYSFSDAPDFLPDDLPSVTLDEYLASVTGGIACYFVRPNDALTESTHSDKAYEIVDELPDFMKPRTVRAVTRAGQSPHLHLVRKDTFGWPSAKYTHDAAENVYATEELRELAGVFNSFLADPRNIEYVEKHGRVILDPLHAKVEADYRKTPHHQPEHWKGLRDYASAMAQMLRHGDGSRTNAGFNIAQKLEGTDLEESGMQSIMDYAQQPEVDIDQLKRQVVILSNRLWDGTTPQPRTLADFNHMLKY